eukprot:TRINITY_DN685_c0_g1_i13.p1 TRINITY_DN685_c0_g1~~TRINITY_DN685_c0_g1_i13.p1  ORF type:complete len:333 (+),score=114.78 TRINITY_DN685_c0_g1_i13:1614-2612(+)
MCVCNGTVALELVVKALGIGKGDEVIMPSFTIISCAAGIYRNGATPVCVDMDPETFNMTLEGVKAAYTENTKAIMIVHLYGLPVDLDGILEFAKEKNLKVIEDAAEMHGQTYKGKPCGSFGDVSTFSFYPNKHVTTGEGGIIVCDDDDLAEYCRNLRNLCFGPTQGTRFMHSEMGWNFRMSNLQAAVGVAQLEQLDDFVEKKRVIGSTYNELLADIEEIQLPVPKTDYADNIYWVYSFVLDKSLNTTAEEFMKRLGAHKIGSRPFFYPTHMQPVFKDAGLFKDTVCENAEDIWARGLYIPSGLSLTQEQMERVAKVVHTVIEDIKKDNASSE